MGVNGDNKAGRDSALTDEDTVPQCLHEADGVMSGDGNQVQPTVRVSRQVHSDDLRWSKEVESMGHGVDQWGAWPGTGMAAAWLRWEPRMSALGWMQLLAEGEEAQIRLLTPYTHAHTHTHTPPHLEVLR